MRASISIACPQCDESHVWSCDSSDWEDRHQACNQHWHCPECGHTWDKRDAILHQATTPDERHDIANALRIAAEEYEKHAAGFHAVAADCRAGKAVAGWAKGEGGALGAERMAKEFEKQRDEARKLMERFA